MTAAAYQATGVRFLRTTDILESGRLKDAGVFLPQSLVQEYLLREGDLLISRSGTVGRSFLYNSREHGLCAYAGYLVRFVPDSNVLPKYLFLFTKTRSFADFVQATAISSTIDNVNAEKYGNCRLPLPPRREQHAITKFLDRETAKIDALIAKQEALIELLREKRTSLISHAVTKGLDPDAPMRDSGVEWLGEIPAHWEVERVKWVARMESGHTPDKKIDAYWNDGDIPWVSLSDTGQLKDQDYIRDTEYYTNQLGLRNSSARLLPPRSVIFSRDATIGLCAITKLPMAVSQHFIAWICNDNVAPEYLLRVFDTMQGELVRLTMGATLRTIGMPDVKTLKTPVPPVPEQDQIVAFVRKETAAINALIAKANEAIAHLTEYRTALISAAVIGQIDVRNHPEPDAPDAARDAEVPT